MFKLKVILAVTMLLGLSKLVSPTGIGDIQTIVNFANDAWGVLNGDLPVSALLTGSTGVMLDKIMAGVEEVAEKLDELADTVEENGRKIDDMTALLEQMIIKLPLQDKLDKSMRKLQSYMERVDLLYSALQRFSVQGKNFSRFTMLQYFDSVISEDAGDLVDVLTQMHHLFVPGRSATYKDSLFYVLSEKMQDDGDIECNKGISSQARIYEIFKSLQVTEIRAYVITLATYSLLSVYENVSYRGELGLARDNFITRSRKYLSAAQLTLETASRSINLCDIGPFNYRYPETYVKFRTSYNLYNPNGHTFSLLPVRTRFSDNMVVTGVRFAEKNGVIFPQLKEAKLLPKGYIDMSTEKWIPLPDYEIRWVTNDYVFYHAGTDTPVNVTALHTLTSDSRGYFLDRILLSPNRLIAGIEFEMRKGDVLMTVLTREFNYETGQLVPETGEWWSWISSLETPEGIRKYRRFRGLKDPSKVNQPQKINSIGKEWFQFVVENDEIDANLIPMFDARPVETNLPLSGIELFHRGSRESGGILHFKLFTFDVSNYMNREIDGYDEE